APVFGAPVQPPDLPLALLPCHRSVASPTATHRDVDGPLGVEQAKDGGEGHDASPLAFARAHLAFASASGSRPHFSSPISHSISPTSASSASTNSRTITLNAAAPQYPVPSTDTRPVASLILVPQPYNCHPNRRTVRREPQLGQ